jgi:hypothetical protein
MFGTVATGLRRYAAAVFYINSFGSCHYANTNPLAPVMRHTRRIVRDPLK